MQDSAHPHLLQLCCDAHLSMYVYIYIYEISSHVYVEMLVVAHTPKYVRISHWGMKTRLGANPCATFAGFCVWVTGTMQRTHNRVSLGIIKQKQLLRITRLVGLKALGHHLGQEQVEWVSIQGGLNKG